MELPNTSETALPTVVIDTAYEKNGENVHIDTAGIAGYLHKSGFSDEQIADLHIVCNGNNGEPTAAAKYFAKSNTVELYRDPVLDMVERFGDPIYKQLGDIPEMHANVTHLASGRMSVALTTALEQCIGATEHGFSKWQLRRFIVGGAALGSATGAATYFALHETEMLAALDPQTAWISIGAAATIGTLTAIGTLGKAKPPDALVHISLQAQETD